MYVCVPNVVHILVFILFVLVCIDSALKRQVEALQAQLEHLNSQLVLARKHRLDAKQREEGMLLAVVCSGCAESPVENPIKNPAEFVKKTKEPQQVAIVSNPKFMTLLDIVTLQNWKVRTDIWIVLLRYCFC